MIPILQNQNTVLGFLPDALSCTVTEERNGIYELEMTYPVSAPMFSSLAVDKYIKAKPNDTADPQLFRIYEITKPINGIVTICAEHISYALSHYPVNNVSVSGTATQAINTLLTNANNNLSSPHGFTVSSTGSITVKSFSFAVGTVRSALGGTEGSVLNTFGGEYEFDNKVIKLHSARGTDTGVIIAYGKNMTDIKATTSMEASYTHLFPYVLKDDTLTLITNRTIAVTNTAGIAERVLVKDFTSFFDTDETISPTTLQNKANTWLASNDINSPQINVTVSFLHLWQSPEYAQLAALEKVSLCDSVTIYHKDLDVNIKAKVIKTVYDSLGEKYEKIELGTAKANFEDTVRQTVNEATDGLSDQWKADIAASSSAVTQAYLTAIDNATKAITGYSGGYVVLNPSQNPQELLIMNTANKSTATKVWRWNLGGLGYSSNGYNGPYSTAITMNGQINADFITTGTLTANIITAGVLQSSNGQSFFNLETGLIQTNNAKITGGSIKIGGTSYYTQIEAGSLIQYSSGGTIIGGLVPVSSSGEYAQAIYYRDNGTARAVDISYQNDTTGSFPTIGQFNKDIITFYAPLDLPGYTISSRSDAFSGLTHTRTNMDINRGTHRYRVKCGAGVITSHYNSYSFTTYKNSAVTTKTSGSYTYYARTSLTSAGTHYRLTNDIPCSGAKKAYASFYANSYGRAFIYLDYCTTSSTLYVGQLLASPWNSEISYTGQIDLPNDATSWCLCVVPDTGYSSYWAGVRNCTLRNYCQDPTGAIELSDSNGDIMGRLDVFDSWGEAAGGIRLNNGRTTSSILELGSGELYYNGVPILDTLRDYEERITRLEGG